jgi:hypothetical protein
MTRRELFAAGIGSAVTAVVVVALTYGVLDGTAQQKASARSTTTAASSTAAAAPSEKDEQVWRAANANLAETVRLAQRRLEQNEAEKRELERELKEARAKLAATEGDGAATRNEFDLTPDDWKELAKTGTVKARYPCRWDPEWHLGAWQIQALGLSPDEVRAVETAYMNEEDRLAGVIQSGCAKVLNNAELARRLGTKVCAAVVSDSMTDMHTDQQLVADIRAGNVPMPPADKLDPFAAMLLAESSSMQALQSELAGTLGPDGARRVVFSDELGSCSGTWGSPPPKH